MVQLYKQNNPFVAFVFIFLFVASLGALQQTQNVQLLVRGAGHGLVISYQIESNDAVLALDRDALEHGEEDAPSKHS